MNIISALRHIDAERRALEEGVIEYIWVPYTEPSRSKRLKSLKLKKSDRIIGKFTKEELTKIRE